MRLEYLAASFILFGLIVLSGTILIGDINNNYGLSISDSEFTDVYNTINETYEISKDMQGHVDGQINEEDTANSMFSGSYSAIRLVWSFFSLFGDIVNAIAEALGIPQLFVISAVTILTIFVVFSVAYLVMRIGT